MICSLKLRAFLFDLIVYHSIYLSLLQRVGICIVVERIRIERRRENSDGRSRSLFYDCLCKLGFSECSVRVLS